MHRDRYKRAFAVDTGVKRAATVGVPGGMQKSAEFRASRLRLSGSAGPRFNASAGCRKMRQRWLQVESSCQRQPPPPFT